MKGTVCCGVKYENNVVAIAFCPCCDKQNPELEEVQDEI